MERLKAISPDLGCKYEPGHEHFVITHRRPIGQPVPILLIEGDQGEFRHPDQRDIKKILESDTHRVPVKDRLKVVAKYMEDDRAKKRKAVKDEIRERTKDDRRQLTRAFARAANVSKANSEFRRVDIKPRGVTIP
jgi:hypothetical protein